MSQPTINEPPLVVNGEKLVLVCGYTKNDNHIASLRFSQNEWNSPELLFTHSYPHNNGNSSRLSSCEFLKSRYESTRYFVSIEGYNGNQSVLRMWKIFKEGNQIHEIGLDIPAVRNQNIEGEAVSLCTIPNLRKEFPDIAIGSTKGIMIFDSNFEVEDTTRNFIKLKTLDCHSGRRPWVIKSFIDFLEYGSRVLLFSGANDNKGKVYDVLEKKFIDNGKISHTKDINGLDYCTKTQRLFVAAEDSIVSVYKINRNDITKEKYSFKHNSLLYNVMVFQRGEIIVTCEWDGDVYIWNTRNKRKKKVKIFQKRNYSWRMKKLDDKTFVVGGDSHDGSGCGIAILNLDGDRIGEIFKPQWNIMGISILE